MALRGARGYAQSIHVLAQVLSTQGRRRTETSGMKMGTATVVQSLLEAKPADNGTAENAPVVAESVGEKRAPGLRDRERITALAYRLWIEHGRPEGSPDDDWYRAQAAIMQEPMGAIQSTE